MTVDVHRVWECPACHHHANTADPRAAVPFHPCPAHRGMPRPYAEPRGGRLELNRGLPTHQYIRKAV